MKARIFSSVHWRTFLVTDMPFKKFPVVTMVSVGAAGAAGESFPEVGRGRLPREESGSEDFARGMPCMARAVSWPSGPMVRGTIGLHEFLSARRALAAQATSGSAAFARTVDLDAAPQAPEGL